MSEYDAFDEIEEESPQGNQGSNPVKQLRDALKAKDKESKAMLKELEELRAFRGKYESDQKVAKAAETFTKYGLTEKHAELFYKLNPELTDFSDQAVLAFAEEWALPIKQSEGEEGDPTPGAEEEPFVPVEGGSPQTGYMSRADLEVLYKQNPRKALATLQSGKVKWNNPDD